MRDSYGREIDYLRISLTSCCNLRCLYCRPKRKEEGRTEQAARQKTVPFSVEQLLEIAEAAASVGVRKIKLTGGEPLLFPELAVLIAGLKRIPGITQVTLTTNGVLLAEQLPQLMKSGLDGVNISLDTADRAEYGLLTGTDCLDRVLLGLEACLESKINVKLNCVAADFQMKKQEGSEGSSLSSGWRGVVELAGARQVPVRLIELMPIGMGSCLRPLSVDEIRAELEKCYGSFQKDDSIRGNGPAVYYRLPGLQAPVGFICALHEKFCRDCNRIRMTSSGVVKGCLCYASGVSVRPAFMLPAGERKSALRELFHRVIQDKPGEHCFGKPEGMTEQNTMEKIGG